MNFSRIKSIALLGLLLTSSACEKDFLDINTDPNNPLTADVNQVLPSGQAFVSFVVGGQLNIMGEILAQHMGIPSGGNQYRTWDQYNIPTSTFDGRQFQYFYGGALEDFQYVINTGTPANEWRIVGIAKILKAHTYQIITDLYGDVPFSDALQGNAGNTAPKYDRQQDIYAGLQLLLDDAIGDIQKQQGRFPGTSDLNYGATNEAAMTRWIRMAKTLKLRLYIHQSIKDPAGAAAGIRALYANGGAAQFMQSGESFQYNNSTASNSENPFYQANQRLPNNLGVSSTVGNIMTASEDPRRSVFFLDADLRIPPGSTTSPVEYLFVEPGQAVPYPNNYTFPGSTTPTNRVSYPGTWFIGQNFTNAGAAGSTYAGITATDAAAKSRPTLLLTYEESLFLRAEATLRGWTTGEDAKSLYESAVTASLTRYGVGASATAYLARPQVNFVAATTTDDKLKLIWTQKYISFFGTNGVEAWTEVRRTDTPALKSPLTNTLGAGKFVKRLPYPDSELLRNTANVSATGITAGDLTTPVWWDVN